MREEEIKKYIDRLNDGNYTETIFLRQISKYVYLARVWEKEPSLEDEISFCNPSYQFFFIKNDNEKFVGAVLDMIRDLHWVVLKEERKKGYLSKALKETIVPFIFYDDSIERDCLRITIEKSIGEDNYRNSKRVAESIGFKPLNEDETEFEIEREKFDWQFENLSEQNGRISRRRFKELKRRIHLNFKELRKISDELLMAYDNDGELKEIANKVGCYHTIIEDIMIDNEEKTEANNG